MQIGHSTAPSYPLSPPQALSSVRDVAVQPDHLHDVVKPVDSAPEGERSGDPSQQPPKSSSSGGQNGDESKTQSQKQTEKAQQERQAVLDQQTIKALAARDREVRAHEQAHMAVGGQYAGSASYTYERGPNGVNYAVGGEVPISTGKAATPEQTLQKAQVVRRAALAPAEPSATDRQVAAEATRMEAQARKDIALARQREVQEEAKQREAAQSDDNHTAADAAEPSQTQDTTSRRDPSRAADDSPYAAIQPFGVKAVQTIYSYSQSPVVGASINQMA